MGSSVFPVATTSSLQVSNGPLAALPLGVSLRRTYTTSTTGITGMPDVVCVVMVGGGAAGGTTAGGNTSVNSSPFFAPGAPNTARPGLVVMSLANTIAGYSFPQSAQAPTATATSGSQTSDGGLSRTGYAGTAVDANGAFSLGAGGGSGWYGNVSAYDGGAGGTPNSTIMGVSVTGVGGAGQTLVGGGAYRSGAGGGGGGLTGAGGSAAQGSSTGGSGGNGTGIGSGGAGAGGQGSSGNGGYGGGAGGMIILTVPAFTACTIGAGGTGGAWYSWTHGNGAPGGIQVYW